MDDRLKQGFYLDGWEVRPLLGKAVGPDGEVHVEPKVMEVLVALASRPGEVVERDVLADEVWQGRAMSDEPLNRCIAQLRRVLGDSRHEPRFVQTVPKRGYRLVAEVRLMQPPETAGDAAVGEAVTPPPGPRLRRFAWLALAAALVLAFAAVLVMDRNGSPVEPAPRSIAVLPFVILSDDGDDHFGDGLSEEIRNRLSGVPEVTVTGRTSSEVFRGSNEDAKSIMDRLAVGHLLEGSVRRDGDRIRIQVYLVDRNGNRVWSESYQGILDDVFAIQDDIANDIVDTIAPELVQADSGFRIRTPPPTANMDAYELVLWGRAQLARRDEGPLRGSIASFQQAIDLDDAYGDAYVGLATARALLPFYSYEPVDESFDLAMATIEDGARKDPTVDVNAAGIMAFMLFYRDWRWIEAENAFRRALESTPRHAELLNWYSLFLGGVGRSEASLEYALRGKELDRLSPVVNQRLAIAWLWANQDERAYEQFEIAREYGMAPTAQLEAYLILLLRLGEYDKARTLMLGLQRMMGMDPDWIEQFFLALHDPSHRQAAVDAVDRAVRNNDISNLHLFGVWVYLDELDRAFDAAFLLINDRPNFNTEFLFAEETAALRAHPRFAELIRAMGLDTYWRHFGWPTYCGPEGDGIACR